MWSDGRIVEDEVAALDRLQTQLGLSEDEAAEIEREVMGMTKEDALVEDMGTNTPVPDEIASEGTISGGGTLTPRTGRGAAASPHGEFRRSSRQNRSDREKITLNSRLLKNVKIVT